MILILPQIQFEAIPSKDAGEVAYQSGLICHIKF